MPFFLPRRGPFSRVRSDDVAKFGFGALIRRATKRRTADFADMQHLIQHFYVLITDHLRFFCNFQPHVPPKSPLGFRMISSTVLCEAEQTFIKSGFGR